MTRVSVEIATLLSHSPARQALVAIEPIPSPPGSGRRQGCGGRMLRVRPGRRAPLHGGGGVNADDVVRIEQTHKASVMWLNGAVGWICVCGNAWPCRLLQLADDARQQQARVTRHAGRATS